jgi:hypothetical protein
MIPQDAEDFILRNVDSIAEMETLVLLHRERGKSWESTSLAKRLYITVADAQEVLEKLAARRLLIKTGDTYLYSPSTSEAAPMSLITALYAEQLIAITGLIHSKSRSRVQQFADAFKIKKGG